MGFNIFKRSGKYRVPSVEVEKKKTVVKRRKRRTSSKTGSKVAQKPAEPTKGAE